MGSRAWERLWRGMGVGGALGTGVGAGTRQGVGSGFFGELSPGCAFRRFSAGPSRQIPAAVSSASLLCFMAHPCGAFRRSPAVHPTHPCASSALPCTSVSGGSAGDRGCCWNSWSRGISGRGSPAVLRGRWVGRRLG